MIIYQIALAQLLCLGMNVPEALKLIEEKFLRRSLSPIERLILSESWMGKTYSEISQKSAYANDYVKEVGGRLWQELSEALGTKVSKKNIKLVLKSRHQIPLTSPPVQKSGTLAGNSLNPNDGNNIEIPGSPISINSPFYIERPPIEEMGYNELQQPGCVVRIKAPRKMGKSSLLNRMLTQAVSWGYGTVYLNFLEVDAETFNSLEQLVRWFCANATKQLKLPAKLGEYWDIDLGTKVSCRLYFEEYLFITKDTPIVIAMNEVNRLFEYPVIASDFLPMLRSWHELSKHNKLWENLRLIVVHSTEVYVPLQLHQSPFNVGLVLKLPQFTPQQVQDLALRYELSWAAGESGLKRLEGLISMVGGHPYLVQLAFYTISKSGISLENLIKNARKPDGIYSAYLRDLLVTIQQDSDLHIALNKVLKSDNGVPLEAITAYKLESLGLINFEDNLAKIGCDLYRLYFLEQLSNRPPEKTEG